MIVFNMQTNFLEKTKYFFRNNEYFSIFILVLIFVCIRLPGTDLPLHQDEYKWPQIVNPSLNSDTEIPHPPLSQFIYKTAGQIVGYNVNFRFVPLFFGTINLLLLFYYMKSKWGRRVAFIGSTIFTFSYFNVLASLMVDTDGQILPFFFLTALISYEKIKSIWNNKRSFWIIIFALSISLGLLVKVSFILPVLAILSDFLWQKRLVLINNKKIILKYFSIFLVFISGLILILILSEKLFPFFSLENSLSYWKHFWKTDRNFFQTFIQFAKVMFYSSPLLVLFPFFISKQNLKDSLPHIFYLIYGFLFYIVLFDFSIGALDRYLQFIIVPLTIFSSLVISSLFNFEDNYLIKRRFKEFFLLGSIIALLLLTLNCLNHFVPSLHPKKEWIDRILSLKWNFLYPFSGGSGPLGFYISFLFMALSWLVSIILVFLAFFKKEWKKFILIIILPIALVYNFVFIEEYLFGKINGSAPRLLSDVVSFIKENQDIKYVTVYNDNGGNEVKEIGKYRKRLYTDPAFDINEKVKTLNQYKEHYLEIDVPRIDPKSIYRKYLDSCRIIYKEVDQKISATVYDCSGVEDVKI